MRVCLGATLLAASLAAGPARADRGAVTLEVLPGVNVANVRAPEAFGSPGQLGTATSLAVAGRYGITSGLEVGVAAFWEPPSSWVHAGAMYQQFAGSLTSRSSRAGGLAEVRLVRGLVWRVAAGLAVGLSQRSFSELNLFDISGVTPRNFGLHLDDTTAMETVVAPSLGLRWTGDRVAVGIEPRLEVLIGGSTSWALTVPLTLAWSWFL